MRALLKTLVIVVLAFTITACSSCEVVNESQSAEHKNCIDTRINLEDAIANAETYMSELFGSTRSSLSIASVDYIESHIMQNATRALNDQDTIMYLINYSDNRGFALMSADTRIDPLLAISDEGNLDLNDTTFNEGLRMFFSDITDLTPLPPTDYGNLIKQLKLNQEPLLSKAVRKWGQSHPFNLECPLDPEGSGYNCLTGCVPLAVAQIMSYFKWPDQYRDNIFNWEEICDGEIYGAARIIGLLGNSDNLCTKYGLLSSGTMISNLQTTFQNFKYVNPGLGSKLDIDFDWMTLNKFFNSKANPILIAGGNHCWVGDGYLTVTYDPDMFLPGSDIPEDEKYIHCVWGWFGRGNGYYLAKTFSSLGGKRYKADSTDGVYDGYADVNNVSVFNDLWYWHLFTPNRY